MSKKFVRENTAPKMRGAGDGVKTPMVKTVERVPVPSSRKFTATGNRDDSVRLKLKKVLDDIEAKEAKLKKSQTVAEITPTKSKRAKTNDASSTLHATPRPATDGWTPSRRSEEKRRLERLVYERMLLFVWRRNKTRLAMLSESLRRRQDQICQLEKQRDCLKSLQQSEHDRRNEAVAEAQKMESLAKKLTSENDTLVAEKAALQKQLEELRFSFENVSVELQNVKNDLISKITYLKRLETEMQKERSLVKYMKEQKMCMVNEMRSQEAVMKNQVDLAEKLKETLKNLEAQMRNKEASVEMQISDLKRTAERYHQEIKKNESLNTELFNQRSINEEMRKKQISLERELASINDCYVHMINENTRLKMELERKCLWKNAKNFISITWVVLRNAAYIMLPAM